MQTQHWKDVYFWKQILSQKAMLGTEIQQSQLCNCMGYTCSYIRI